MREKQYQPADLNWMKEYYETIRCYKKNRTRVFLLFGIGLFINIGLWGWYAKSAAYHPVLEQLQVIHPDGKETFFLYWNEWQNSGLGMRILGIIILLGAVICRTYQLLCQIGFLFGIWWIWKRICTKGILFCILSCLFCFITVWFYLGAAYVIAGAVMLYEFMELRIQKVKLAAHEKAIRACENQVIK